MPRPSESPWAIWVEAGGTGTDTSVVDFPVFGHDLQWLNVFWWSATNAKEYHANPEAFRLLMAGGFIEAVLRPTDRSDP